MKALILSKRVAELAHERQGMSGGRLIIVWGGFDFALLAGGLAATSAAALVRSNLAKTDAQKTEQILDRLAFDDSIATIAGLTIGIMTLIGFLISISAQVAADNKTRILRLRAFGYYLVALIVSTIIAGVIVWLQTLRPADEIELRWPGLNAASQKELETAFACSASQSKIQSCLEPIAAAVTTRLGFAFTALHAFSGVQLMLWLLTAALIVQLQDRERARRIDARQAAEAQYKL
ncbi:uncharacterized protein L969DRAFT_92035 [Mixia osmundae IAM 14324]|uniref:MARVEL domain-containing protein n=1 Tax=Mixia osmundae (strain CBS 9802 / IAM 14324 / JCM 22182 / KY 12970) TaxID=764103 RepID=G7DZC5_MIXOS|nr:uncharacterized protein L969DRAFT_92035 [Mixia osmundae IAM 14324]KEI42600.1 hypothetical protein L969DRAFT_92035 [Mixia osmundae IAM 14324]GAA95935.1 hypothetical protein E5Q_02593 [Mixia osmundae IAM 14324]